MSKRAKQKNKESARKSLNKSLNTNKSNVNKRRSRRKSRKSDICKNIRLPMLKKLPFDHQNQVKIVSTPVEGHSLRSKRNRKAGLHKNSPNMLKNSSFDHKNQVKIVSTPVGGTNLTTALRRKCIKNICKASFKTNENNIRTPINKDTEANSSDNKDNSVILLDVVPKSIEQNDSVILIDITQDSFVSQDSESQTDKNSVPKKICSDEPLNEVENGVIEIDDLDTDNVINSSSDNFINLTSDTIINLTSDTECGLNESSDIICLNSPEPTKVAHKRKLETVVLDIPDTQKNKNSLISFGPRAKLARTQIPQTSTFNNKRLLPAVSFNNFKSVSSSSHQKEHTESDISTFTKRLNNLEQQHLKLVGNMNSTSVNNHSNNNFYHPTVFSKQGLRLIVIDGSNVAMGHSQGKFFSCRGLKICIDYFVKRGHRVKAFVPQFRRQKKNSSCPELLELLAKQNLVVFTPSRTLNGHMVVPYDDRFIIQCAAESEGVVVSNDNYRDLLHENPKWRCTIEKRLLMWTWVDDMIMFPSDPLGRHGPTLDQFLRFP